MTFGSFRGGIHVLTGDIDSTPNTRHSGGVNILLGDGSVRFVRSNVFAVWLTTSLPGLSFGGACQFLEGYIVNDPKDRRILANAMLKGLGFAATGGETAIGLLLPAVQAAREAAKQIQPRSILSAAGALQFLSGDPVSDPNDRKLLALLVEVQIHNKID